MEVNGCTFYHVHVKNWKYSRRWKVGKSIKTDDNYNFFHGMRMANIYRIKDLYKMPGEDYFEHGVEFVAAAGRFYDDINDIEEDEIPAVAKDHLMELMKLAFRSTDALQAYVRFLIEFIIEHVRRKEYPNLPSRTKGIWLTNKAGLKIWSLDYQHIQQPKRFISTRFGHMERCTKQMVSGFRWIYRQSLMAGWPLLGLMVLYNSVRK